MDIAYEHGENSPFRCYTYLMVIKAIAVNPEMDYSLVKRHETGDFLIVGTELLSNLQGVLGESDILHTCKGNSLA